MGDVQAGIQSLSVSRSSNGLSRRGENDLETVQGRMGMLKKIISDLYDEKDNPDGLVLLGIADNSLCRKELVEFFCSPGRLVLEPRDLTYADTFFASSRVIQSVANLYNNVPDGLYTEESWTPPLTKVTKDHILIGNGATEILEAVFWDLCDDNDGVLLSTPYYNAFDEDLSFRAKVQIVPVDVPLPEASNGSGVKQSLNTFAEDTVGCYEKSLADATSKGIRVRAVLICNPHNPTGGIYPRSTIVALAAFAAKHDLHLVMDEIYARSVFPTRDVPNPTQFDSILRIDTKKEAGLDPSRVHVISSASKDFSINGFRIGIFISQHNPDLMDALFANARFAQTASPAGQLFASLLNDKEYLAWFLAENRRRLTASFDWMTDFLNHHKIPYVPGNAGHFLMIDLRAFMDQDVIDSEQSTAPTPNTTDDVRATTAAAAQSKATTPERDLTYRMIKNRVMVAPGAQYHYPVPGFFRLTFSIDPKTLHVGLSRLEKALGLQSWISEQPVLQFD